jgi:hypothetical protein
VRTFNIAILVGAALSLAGCGMFAGGPVLHREMLGKAIAEFSNPLKDQNVDKLWITNMTDSGCDCHDQVCHKPEKGALGGFSFGGGGGSYDGLAFEVFSNYLVQKKKGRVVETHRHNYSTDLKVATHTPLEADEEHAVKKHVVTQTCEDLCLLDEAKKRAADKILAYSILTMTNDEMRIHLRLSDVKTGLVEFSRTLFVQKGAVTDISF